MPADASASGGLVSPPHRCRQRYLTIYGTDFHNVWTFQWMFSLYISAIFGDLSYTVFKQRSAVRFHWEVLWTDYLSPAGLQHLTERTGGRPSAPAGNPGNANTQLHTTGIVEVQMCLNAFTFILVRSLRFYTGSPASWWHKPSCNDSLTRFCRVPFTSAVHWVWQTSDGGDFPQALPGTACYFTTWLVASFMQLVMWIEVWYIRQFNVRISTEKDSGMLILMWNISPSPWFSLFVTGVFHMSFHMDKKEAWSFSRRGLRSAVMHVTQVSLRIRIMSGFKNVLVSVVWRRSPRTSTKSCRMCANISIRASPTSPASWCPTPASKWPLTLTLMEELKVHFNTFH